jgi:hypothetical protein
MADFSGKNVLVAGIGGVLLWSGIKGIKASEAVRSLLQGKDPHELPVANRFDVTSTGSTGPSSNSLTLTCCGCRNQDGTGKPRTQIAALTVLRRHYRKANIRPLAGSRAVHMLVCRYPGGSGILRTGTGHLVKRGRSSKRTGGTSVYTN